MGGDVEAIKERLSIVEVVGGYIKLEKSGSNFKARCPFHSEKTASFYVSPTRQGYYCFGCGAKGDIFTFVEEMEGVDFKEALRTLADRAGVEIKRESGLKSGERNELIEIMEAATLYYESCLSKDSNTKKYLESRGVKESSLKSFRLGLAPKGWRNVREHLKKLGFSDAKLQLAGLVKRSTEGAEREPYDVFRERLMFPLMNERGQVIAFSGRALAKDGEPKYLNSPDTPLFVKSGVLYGLDKALDEIRKKKYTVLVEGQLDLVLSHQAGVKNTVASSGTAFTETHLKRLKALSANIVIGFDGDQAGVKATERSTALAFTEGLRVNVAKLPEGEDPADVVKKDPEQWKKIVNSSEPAIKFFLDVIFHDKSLDHRKRERMVEARVLPLVASMANALEREHAVSLVAQRLTWSPSRIWESVQVARKNSSPVLEKKNIEGIVTKKSRTEIIADELLTLEDLIKSLPKGTPELEKAERHKRELESQLLITKLEVERDEMRAELVEKSTEKALREYEALVKKIDETKRKVL